MNPKGDDKINFHPKEPTELKILREILWNVFFQNRFTFFTYMFSFRNCQQSKWIVCKFLSKQWMKLND